ncbi:hypothetical protein PARPLA_00954 [Rhodobacteraceae bacterium THAF1]|uniref:hypothetical protein n=1 Tax=Palleronia sp. THAF1 TaxID=2587842 RepID=UPI000F3C6097|nr:hypothetical protein [Palleronia sp. THAF1]QFU07490.1 hypothetical protein FIU81_02245 [Palleronia sp. THAF1]VDC20438.1 hypothetical protein PARPLA_00954 [Rhodobacteraceae bacterium THAF1]
MQKTLTLTLTLATLISTATVAVADRAMVSDHGVVYSETAFDSGSRLVRANETITLTDRCTAKIDGKGNGSWRWNAGGTEVTVGTYAVRFDDVPLISMMACAS